MKNLEVKNYRDKLATELKEAPKDMRIAILNEARQSADYIEAFLEHSKPRWDKKEAKREQKLKKQDPNLDFNLDNIDDLKQKLNKLGEYIYSTIGAWYDPQKGHMLCGEITDKFIDYLKSKGVDAKRISRVYEIKDPDGNYNDSFGHVYLTIDRPEDHTLVDPTYKQWLTAEQRQDRPHVLVIRFKDEEDFRTQFNEVPIKQGITLPFYLGFDSEEAKQFFKDSKYTVLSEDRARIDD